MRKLIQTCGPLRRLEIALLVLALVPSAVHGATRNFQNYGRAQGIPQSQVLAVAQDKTGYIWVGTYGGIARYNGQQFVPYTVSDGLASNSVDVLTVAPDNSLIIGTRGGYCHFDRERFNCETPSSGFPAEIVYAALKEKEVLWLGTNRGLIRIENGRHELFDTSSGLPAHQVNALHRDTRDGTIWLGTEKGLARFQDRKITLLWPETLGSSTVNMILEVDEGHYVGTDRGLYFIDESGATRVETGPDQAMERFHDGVVGPEGDLWFGSSHGVLRISGKEREWMTRADGLKADHVHDILVDRENTIWFGTDNGLSKLVLSPFTAYTERHGLRHPFIRSVAEDERGRVWLGTKQGISIFDSGRIHSLPLPEPYNNAKIYALAKAPPGGMLIGTVSGLLWWRDGTVERVYNGEDGLPSTYVAAIARDGDGVWLGTRSGISRWKDGQIQERVNPRALNDAFILAMTVDDRGRLWLGLSNGGVVMVHNGRIRRYGPDAGLTDHTIWSLAQAADGSIWVGTNGDGAFRISDTGVEQLDVNRGLASNIVWQILPDDNGNIWLYTNDGLDRLHDGRITHHGRSSGLLSFEGSTNAAIQHSSGDLFFGTGRGLIHYRDDARKPRATAPPIVIESVLGAGGSELRHGEVLPYDFRQVTVEYAGLSYRAEAALRYRFRLKGLADEWSAPTSRNSVRYGQLAPGQYVFQVIAQNDTGLWSPKPARFAFSVSSPLWQTWWFWVMASIGGIVLVSSGAWWRLRSLQAIRRSLKAEVGERTRELERINAELHQLSITDELTDLFNRRYLHHAVELELQRLSRRSPGSTMCLMLMDLDHFKRVNDRHGHLTGDHALRETADRIRQETRRTDIVARYGGEEFAVILPDTPIEGALTLAEKLRVRFQDDPFTVVPEQPFTVTISVGVGQFRQEEVGRNPTNAIERFVTRADNALYRAKQAGRNRVASDGKYDPKM